MSFLLRPLTIHDFPLVDPLLAAAYTRSTSMLDDLVHYHRLQPDGWVLALRNDIPIGVGGALVYRSFARIGLMAVRPELQHQGIGTAIMHYLLEWTAKRGATTVFLDATPTGVPLYTKLGFISEDYACSFTQKHPASFAGASKINTMLLEPGELAEMVKYDAERFGVLRTPIVASYPEKFPDRTFVARNNQGSMTGYIVAQSHRLGPWWADTPEVANALLQQILQLSFSQPPMALVPEYNQAAQILLERAGFRPGRRWHSMRRGGVPDLHRRQWLYGYANFYVG